MTQFSIKIKDGNKKWLDSIGDKVTPSLNRQQVIEVLIESAKINLPSRLNN